MKIKSKALRAVIGWAARWSQSDGKPRVVLAKSDNKKWYVSGRKYHFFVDDEDTRNLANLRKWLIVGVVDAAGTFRPA